MTWNPDGVVTIGGVDFTGETLWNVSISYGRNSIWEQARAGYASISILNANNDHFDFDINDAVTITIENSSGTPVTVFTGKVSNIANAVQNSGRSATVVVQTLTAVSVFADMARKVIGDTSWPKEDDDDRMTRIFNDAGVTIDQVDTPAIYEFTTRDASPADSWTLAAYYAQMAFGYIYETTSGEVGFANESHRFVDARDNGYLNIDNSYILWQGVASEKTLADIMNSIILSYKSNAQVTADDVTSQGIYGLIAGSVQTELEKMADAQLQADRYITLRANPRTSLSSFTVQLDSSLVSDADRNSLIACRMGLPIRITNLPLGIKDTTYSGFVESWTLSFNRYQASITLNSSDVAYSVTPTRWQDVQATLAWNAVDPAKTWITYDD